jgi:hypothetical protein
MNYSSWPLPIIGEMHSGFGSLLSAMPRNMKGNFPTFKVWARAEADTDRITAIWRDCLNLYGGPYLLGERSMADAMNAPVVTRLPPITSNWIRLALHTAKKSWLCPQPRLCALGYITSLWVEKNLRGLVVMTSILHAARSHA